MPRVQQPKIKGAICNVPVRADAVSECLARGMDSKKLIFHGHVYFEDMSIGTEY